MLISMRQLRAVITMNLVEAQDLLRKQLEEYTNKGYFMTFSDLLKVGINPKSSFGTPVGVYAYPVTDAMLDWKEQEIVDDEGMGDPSTLDVSKPFKGAMFASNRKYVHILAIRNSANVVDNNISADHALEIANSMNAVVGLPKINKIEYDDADERTYGGEYVSVKTPMGWLWKHSNILRTSPSLKAGKTSDTFAWNKLWRTVGIDGVVDHGDRIIHIHEPAQAVFFSAKAYDHIDTFEQKLKPEDQENVDREAMIDKVNRAPDLQLRKLYKKANPKNSTGIAAIIKIAINVNTPVDLLKQMIDDGYGTYVANNLKLPIELQSQITHSNDKRAKRNLANNQSIDTSTFEELLSSNACQLEIALNKSCPTNTLRKLANSDDVNVLQSLTFNPNTPDDILNYLAKSKHDKVREYAITYQKQRGLI